ncbi:MAG: hypothetical protein GC162_00065 [Planctomycetes bacterium]|nr:hypothetical protein [Planctomycetota bacterium]
MNDALESLTLRYLDGLCSAGEWSRLQSTLRGDAAAQRRFVGFCLERRAMREALSRKGSIEALTGTLVPSVRARWGGVATWAAAAMILLGVTAGLWRWSQNTLKPGANGEAAPVAMITDLRGATWAGEADAPAVGTPLRAGEVELTSGSAQIMLDRGAVVDLIAPVRLNLIDANQMSVHEGRVAAWVPEQAHGFTVRTAGGSVVDLGTAFDLSVTRAGAMDVMVRVGQVRLDLPGRPARILTAGDGAYVEAPGATGTGDAAVMMRRALLHEDFETVADTAELARRGWTFRQLTEQQTIRIVEPTRSQSGGGTNVVELSDMDGTKDLYSPRLEHDLDIDASRPLKIGFDYLVAGTFTENPSVLLGSRGSGDPVVLGVLLAYPDAVQPYAALRQANSTSAKIGLIETGAWHHVDIVIDPVQLGQRTCTITIAPAMDAGAKMTTRTTISATAPLERITWLFNMPPARGGRLLLDNVDITQPLDAANASLDGKQ